MALFGLIAMALLVAVCSASPQYMFPDDPAYAQAKLNWNQIRPTRPAVLAFCSSEQDVQEAVQLAKRMRVPISIRSGRHSWESLSTEDGTMVVSRVRFQLDTIVLCSHTRSAVLQIDVGRMNAITVDSASATITAMSGARMGVLHEEVCVAVLCVCSCFLLAFHSLSVVAGDSNSRSQLHADGRHGPQRRHRWSGAGRRVQVSIC